jgi:hypothetical protein
MLIQSAWVALESSKLDVHFDTQSSQSAHHAPLKKKMHNTEYESDISVNHSPQSPQQNLDLCDNCHHCHGSHMTLIVQNVTTKATSDWQALPDYLNQYFSKRPNEIERPPIA